MQMLLFSEAHEHSVCVQQIPENEWVLFVQSESRIDALNLELHL